VDRLAESVFPEEAEIPTAFKWPGFERLKTYLIDGEIRTWRGAVIPVISPISVRRGGRLERIALGSYPALTGRESLRPLDAAVRAFGQGRGEWPALSIGQRAAALEKFMRRIARKKSEICRSLMWEIAKPYAELEDEFERTIDFLRRTLDAARGRERSSAKLRRDKGIVGIVRDEPLGVVLCMGPYNYPFFETMSLAGPALVMGNTLVLKPPRFGVLFFGRLLEDLRDSFPAGAVNVIFGEGPTVVEPLMKSGRVDVLAFIGSSLTANHLMGLHPHKNRLQAVLGLGAKNAAIVLADADIDVAVKESLLGALAFNGQRCAALKVFFVHKRIAADYLEALTEGVEGVRVGMPWVKGVRITPLADGERVVYLNGLVKDARRKGARVLNAGGGTHAGSLFWPTLLSPVNERMRIHHEEQFGPILPVIPFDRVEEPLEFLRRSPYGQQLSVFGADPAGLRPVLEAARTQVARININSKCQRGPDIFPFTGRKDSAKGDFSRAGILDLLSARSVVAARETGEQSRFFKLVMRTRR
jgi:glyceraldehyde-3-phosphate dehydrogenase (NADP+)